MKWLVPYPESKEDRVLLLALKVGVVAGVLVLELIVLASFAYVMWQAVNG
jgi:hypothetical protein